MRGAVYYLALQDDGTFKVLGCDNPKYVGLSRTAL